MVVVFGNDEAINVWLEMPRSFFTECPPDLCKQLLSLFTFYA